MVFFCSDQKTMKKAERSVSRGREPTAKKFMADNERETTTKFTNMQGKDDLLSPHLISLG